MLYTTDPPTYAEYEPVLLTWEMLVQQSNDHPFITLFVVAAVWACLIWWLVKVVNDRPPTLFFVRRRRAMGKPNSIPEVLRKPIVMNAVQESLTADFEELLANGDIDGTEYNTAVKFFADACEMDVSVEGLPTATMPKKSDEQVQQEAGKEIAKEADRQKKEEQASSPPTQPTMPKDPTKGIVRYPPQTIWDKMPGELSNKKRGKWLSKMNQLKGEYVEQHGALPPELGGNGKPAEATPPAAPTQEPKKQDTPAPTPPTPAADTKKKKMFVPGQTEKKEEAKPTPTPAPAGAPQKVSSAAEELLDF